MGSINSINISSKLHWYHWLIVGLSLLLTLSAWYITSEQQKKQNNQQFTYQSSQVIQLVKERMEKYEEALWAGVATIKSHGNEADTQIWKDFSSALSIDLRYPGINGIGVLHYISPSRLANYLAKERITRPDYRIHPAHNESEYWPITLIEPVSANKKAVGLDMAHESNRFTAAKKARDTNSSQITGPIILVQDAKKTPGFLFYAPYYSTSPAPTSIEARRQTFIGNVYAPFIMEKLMRGTLLNEKRLVHFKITDGTDELYNELNEKSDGFDLSPLYTDTIAIDVYGRTWMFSIQSSHLFRQQNISNQPMIILIGGLIIDAMLLGLILLLVGANKRAVTMACEMTEDLRVAATEAQTATGIAEQRSKELELSDRYKSEFLSNMSHELRTPLNSLLLLANLLQSNRDGNLTQEQVKYARVIKEGGNNLLAIINDILDLSKISAGKASIHIIDVNIREFINVITNRFNPVADDKKLKFSVETAAGTTSVIRTDELRLMQIVTNLLGNAIKFTDQGSVKVNVSTLQSRIDKQTHLKIIIQDTGIGIDKSQHNLIFKAFNQADGTSSRKHEGTGLGLPIADAYCKLLGGEIMLDSQPGHGSTFTLTIPNLSDEAKNSELEPS